MDLQNSAKLCRLCLCNSNRFIDVFEENGELGFIVAKTIEDLLQFKVVKLGNYPWLACATCLEKLVEFRLFKSRCIDSHITYEERFRQFGIGQENIQVVPNETDIGHGNQSISGVKAEMDKMCRVLMKTIPSDSLGSSSTRHNHNNEAFGVVLCKTENNEELNSQEENSDGRLEDIDVEEEENVEIKEEPQDAEQSKAINEVPMETQIQENQSNEEFDVGNMCQVLAKVETSDIPPSSSSWHSYKDEAVNLVLNENRNDDELKSRERNSDGQQENIDFEEEMMDIKEEPQDVDGGESVNRPEVSRNFEADSVPCQKNYFLNSHCDGRQQPQGTEPNGSKMDVASETFEPNSQPSRELEAGADAAVERICCVYCKAIFRTESSLRLHILEHQGGSLGYQRGQLPPPDMDTNADKRMPCGSLNNSTPMNLSKKVSDCLKKLMPAPDVDPPSSALMLKKNKPLKCKKCLQVFPQRQDFRDHESTCTSMNTCSRCKKTFTSYNYLAHHMKTNKSDETFSCRKCHKAFHFKCELMAHRQTHTKIFMCEDCECIFRRYYELREHVLTHCKVKPVVCRDCKETFIGSHALRKHRLENHSGR